jgi:hypothetical protein
MSIYKKLLNIQVELKAPKGQYNSFGKYNYRNSEDILEALKPLLNKNNVTVMVSDKVINSGDRFYIEATVKFIDAETGEIIETTALAREEQTKKGMDSSQITGSASSYARKYALNGMFCIDDTKDADSRNNKDDKPEKKQEDIKNTDLEKAKKIKQVFAIASNQKITKETIDSYIMKVFGKDSMAKMEKSELDTLIYRLQNKQKKAV